MREVTAISDHVDEEDDAPDASVVAGEPEGDGPPQSWRPTLVVEARGRRWIPWVAALAGTAVLGAGLAVGATRLPAGTQLAGRSLPHAGAAGPILVDAQAALDAQTIRLVTEVGTERVATGAELGLVVDPDATLAPVRSGAPALGAWAVRLPRGPQAVPLAVEPVPAAEQTALAESLSRPPSEPVVRVDAAGVEVDTGLDGVEVEAGQVAEALADAVALIATDGPEEWPDVVEVSVGGAVTSPEVTEAQVEAARERIEEVAAAEVSLVAALPLPPDAELPEDADPDDPDPRVLTALELSPRELRALLAVRIDPDTGETQISPAEGPLPSRLTAVLADAAADPTIRAHVEGVEHDPQRRWSEAQLTAVDGIGGEVVVDGFEGGFVPDAAATVAAIVDVAADGGGEVGVAGGPPPEVDAAQLGITEPVATFTTFYTPGQSRNTNIRRIAEMVDGTVIPAGSTYELNHAVGRRTVAGGFAEGGAIKDGELVSDVGGGVSQFATTFFNAAWFAGIDLVEWKPHSIYFDRYPAGREATINYPNVDLEVRNDTPHAILVDTDADEDSVTVTFWSTPHWEVETTSGPCACGGSFRITVDRTRTAPGGEPRTESWTTLYVLPVEPDDE